MQSIETANTGPERPPTVNVDTKFDVVQMPIGDIKPYERNPRKNDNAVDAVAASIKEFGWRVPIVVDENHVVICGDTRLKAARKLGLSTVPVHIAVGLTEEQKRAYRLADNKTAEFATWDFPTLDLELATLKDFGFDMGIFGFSFGYDSGGTSTVRNNDGEIDLSNFSDGEFAHECPRCKFKFN